MKICKDCKLEKDDLDFYKNRAVCKKCLFIKNQEPKKQREKAYYEKNKNKVLDKCKKRY